MNQRMVSVVVPVKDEIECLGELNDRLTLALESTSADWEIIYVDDGSTDGSTALLSGWATDTAHIVLVELSRNFGMDVAMSAGIDHARGDYVVLIHADLQDPPELIPRMLEIAERGADVVYTRRIGRDEGVVKRSMATAFYKIMERLARVPYQGQAGDFRLMSRRVVEAVKAMPERRRFLRAMVAWVGFRQVPVEYHRGERAHGRGSSYRALFTLAFEALAAYSDAPLALAALSGSLVAALSAAAVFVIVAATAVGALTPSISLLVLLALLFLGGVQLICLGIVGRYIARVHAEALHRPLYLTARVVGTTPATPPLAGNGAGNGDRTAAAHGIPQPR